MQTCVPAALSHKGVNVDMCCCSSCIDGLEDAKHVLLRCPCPYVISITDNILGWCGLHQSIEEVIRFAANHGKRPKQRQDHCNLQWAPVELIEGLKRLDIPGEVHLPLKGSGKYQVFSIYMA